MNTIEELKAFRAELVQRRLELVFGLATNQLDRMSNVAHIQATIAAIDAVIEAGDLPPR